MHPAHWPLLSIIAYVLLSHKHLTGIWEHQGADKSWLPFDSSTSELMEAAYSESKPRLTVVFNNQAYWIYFDP